MNIIKKIKYILYHVYYVNAKTIDELRTLNKKQKYLSSPKAHI